MAEQLATADGEPIDLDPAAVEREFAAAMAVPGPGPDEPEAPAPPDIGADEEAPFGRKVDGTPKKGRGGRPPKEPSRTQPAPKALSGPQKPAAGGTQATTPRDYSEGLSEFTDVIWLGLAGLPIPGDERRIRCRVQAAVLKENQEGFVSGVNIIAQHNSVVRWGVEKLATGGGAWIFPAVLALMPFAVQTSMLWRVPVNGDMEKMAAKTEEDFTEVFGSILKQMGLGADDEEPAAAA
jgi:hypothetical protein